jgi:hypothetical protein
VRPIHRRGTDAKGNHSDCLVAQAKQNTQNCGLNVRVTPKEFPMPKVQVISQIELDVDELLQGVARLGSGDLEQFADRVLALRARRRAPSLPRSEAELPQLINRGVPAELRRRYDELNDKLHEETITAEEQPELLGLIEQIEQGDAERLRHLAELAQLRQIPLDVWMDQLGLRRPTYA